MYHTINMHIINELNIQVDNIEACIYVNLRLIEDINITDWKCIRDKDFKKETNTKINELIERLKDLDFHINEKKDLDKKLFNYKEIKKLIKKIHLEMNKMNRLSNKIKPKKMRKKISLIKRDLKNLKTLLIKRKGE